MYCQSCGEKLDGKSRFCPKCGANVEEDVNEAPVAKKHTASKKVKVVLIVVGAFLAIFLLIGWLFGTDEIELVKNGVLSNYNYGKSIGESLDDWFGGNVTWDSYEEYETVYVTASGTCPYTGDMYDSHQTFTFMIIDDEHFRFIGAYGSDGYEIFSKSTYGIIDAFADLYSVVGVDLHESALKAAFGDEESMSGFEKF